MLGASSFDERELTIRGQGFNLFDPIAVLGSGAVYAYFARTHSREGKALGIIMGMVYLGWVAVRFLNRGVHIVINDDGIQYRQGKEMKLLRWSEIQSAELGSQTSFGPQMRGSGLGRNNVLCIKTSSGEEEVALAALDWTAPELQSALERFGPRRVPARRR